MQDHPSDPPRPEESPSATGSWRPTPDRPPESAGYAADDPPTVRRGPGGSASGSGPGMTRPGGPGSGGAAGRGPMEAGLPAAGDRLDSFEVQQAIGAGGMGAVFRALDVRLDRHVALKILPPGQAHEAENVRRFYQEGRAAARLDHENIARVFSIGQDEGLHYIAFEYIEGTTIRQRVEHRGPLPVAEAINFTLQIAGALVHASERGVVHRDIKPSNIIVTPHGRAKLVDMGLARRFEREGADDGLTQSNMTLGTFDYISPEQARDPRSVDVRSDLYSLGCTIYHMLTGQPPFPGGTVLQKLLSHREEPAPDVRGLNPAVPADLAAIVLKLMAKDPDRRYQSPEQLVRDLLTLAGALGLRSISPEGLVWMNAAPRAPGWERHLFWSLPAAALALVVAALVWMGREPEADPTLALAADDLIGPAASALPTPPPPALPEPGGSAPARPRADPAAAPELVATGARPGVDAQAPALRPRERIVRSDEVVDLRVVLRSEPPGSTVVLADDGPYRLSTAPEDNAPIRADLTIRAADEAHPVLEPAPTDGYGAGPRPLLHFAGGRVTIEGLTFNLETDGPPVGPAVRAEGTALTLNRCVVRGAGLPASIELIAPAPGTEAASADPQSADPPRMPALMETCTIGGGRVGILARGPLTFGLRDCTIAVRGPAVWFDNAAASSAPAPPDFGFEPAPAIPAAPPVAARLMLDHVSLLAGAEPVLRFDGTAIRVEASDSLIAPPQALDRFAAGPPTLLAIDDPDRLSWMGFGNLYARLRTYLLPTADPKRRTPIYEFAAWAGGTSTAEAHSRETTAHVWAEPDPGAALVRGLSASQAFRPALSGVPSADRAGGFGPAASVVGARRGPAGAIEPIAVARAMPGPAPDRDAARITGFDPDPMTLGPMALIPDSPEAAGRPPATPHRPRPSEPVEGEAPSFSHALLSPGPPDRPGRDPGADPPIPEPEGSPVPPDPPPPAVVAEAADAPIRTGEQFLDRLGRLGPKGGVLRVAGEARFDLPARLLAGPGIVEVIAEPGPSRPLLRFRPEASEPGGPGAWTTLFRVDREGKLRLRGVDLVLEAEAAPSSGSWAAFGLGPDATLELTGCTVTIDGPRPSAAVRLLADERGAIPLGFGRVSAAPPGMTPGASARVEIVDSLLRCGDDVVAVAPDAQIELELSNAVVACGGSLLHGYGRAEAGAEARLAVVLRWVTAVAHGGIVRLDSTADRPNLPLAEVSARSSILATGPDGGALFRVDGQGELGGLGDRIRIVENREVAYHRVDEYRRDQTSQPGTLPVVLDRDEWSMAVGRVEDDARHGDAGFLSDPDPGRDPRSLLPDDVRLDPEGPAADLGPDLDRIPRPPDAAEGIDDLRGRPGAEVLDRIRRLLPDLP